MCVWFNYLCWGLSAVGTVLCVCLFALNDWNFEKTMYEEENDEKGNDLYC